MTHAAAHSFFSRLSCRQIVSRRWMPVMLSALALAGSPSAWAASTTTSLFTTPGSPSSGQVITMSAQVSSTSFTVAGGIVTFTDTFNGVKQTLGTVQVQSTNGAAGTAILKTEVGGVGNHQFLATYSGTSTFTGSSSAVSVTLAGPYLTATKLASTGTGPYTLTGTVSAYGPVTPSGNVAFVDSTTNYTLGTVPLDSSTLKTGFAPYQSYALGNLNNGNSGGTVVPAIGDFNNDGYLDYAVPSNAGGVVLLLGTGSGTFTTGTPLTTRGLLINSTITPTSVVVGDFNGDGIQDIAVLGVEGVIDIFLGKGNAAFSAATAFNAENPLSTATPASRILAEGDFDRDGIQDLVATNSALNNVSVLRGLGSGSFAAATTYAVSANTSGAAGSQPWNVQVGDLNNDGYLDIVTASDGSGAYSVLAGKSDGTFQTYQNFTTPGAQAGSIVLGDFNGDGKLDVVTSNDANTQVFVLLNTTATAGGTPAFGTAKSFSLTYGPYYMTVGDFNRDGSLDLFVALNGTGATSVGVMLGNGAGGFAAATYYTVGSSSYFVNAADINGDDQVDLTAVTTTGVAVLLSGETESATLPSVASFQGCGTQSIVATYQGDSNYGTSTSAGMTVTPTLLATALGLSIVPVNGVVGQQYTLTATLSPYASGTYTTNGQMITFNANGGPFGTATLSNGVATLLFTPTGTGAYGVSASFTNPCTSTGGFASATSSTINATVKQASTITWNNPAAITYGTPLGATQLNATDNVAGSFSYSPAAGAILGVGTQTLTATFTPTDTTTYGVETATVTIKVNKATPAITWPTPTPITYGTPIERLAARRECFAGRGPGAAVHVLQRDRHLQSRNELYLLRI